MNRLSSELLACWSTVQSHLSSRLLSIDLKIKIYGTLVLFIVVKHCEIETYPLVLGEERKLRLVAKRMIEEYFWTSKEAVTGG
jgi:hypothetical protein